MSNEEVDHNNGAVRLKLASQKRRFHLLDAPEIETFHFIVLRFRHDVLAYFKVEQVDDIGDDETRFGAGASVRAHVCQGSARVYVPAEYVDW